MSEEPKAKAKPLEGFGGKEEVKKTMPKDEKKDDKKTSEEEDKSFAAHVAREGARVAQEVHNERITASAGEAAKGADESTVKDALAFDALDELQIAEEMRGRVITAYFYEFEAGGRSVTGIAYAGIKSVAREMASRGESIDIPEVTFDFGEDENGPWVGCLAKGRNLKTNETRWGYASQSSSMKLRAGGTMRDPFAKQKALSKAQRNVLRAFIPEIVVVEMYREWKKARDEKKGA